MTGYSARVTEARRFFAPYPEGRKPLLMRRRTWEARLEALARAEAADREASRASRAARQAVDWIDEASRADRFVAEARVGNPIAVRIKEAGEVLRAQTTVRELIEERATLVSSLAADGPDVDRHERGVQLQRLESALYLLAYGDASRAQLTEAARRGYRQEIETVRTTRDRERGPDRGLEW